MDVSQSDKMPSGKPTKAEGGKRRINSEMVSRQKS
jgi:hypothetical protein